MVGDFVFFLVFLCGAFYEGIRMSCVRRKGHEMDSGEITDFGAIVVFVLACENAKNPKVDHTNFTRGSHIT